MIYDVSSYGCELRNAIYCMILFVVIIVSTLRDQWLVSTLNEIKTQLDSFASLLQTVVNTNIPSLTLPRDINLPIDNNEDLQQLETNLLNPALKDQLVSNIYVFI